MQARVLERGRGNAEPSSGRATLSKNCSRACAERPRLRVKHRVARATRARVEGFSRFERQLGEGSAIAGQRAEIEAQSR